MIKRYLKPDYIIDYAMNGKEGLILFQENNYDLIITDIHMPFINGSDMIKEIRKKIKIFQLL